MSSDKGQEELTLLRWQLVVGEIEIMAISIGIWHIQDIICHISVLYVCYMCRSEVDRKNYGVVLGIALLKWVSAPYFSVHGCSVHYTTASREVSLVCVTSVSDSDMQWCSETWFSYEMM